MEVNDAINNIFKFHRRIPGRIVSRESSWLEFKESFNWMSKSKYAKGMAAFANNRGGYLVFGVRNKPRELIGLATGNFEDLDESKIAGYLNSCFASEIHFEKLVHEVRGKTIGMLRVLSSPNKPIVCIKTDGDIREAEIYYRYNARSEKIKFPELRSILEEIRQQERESWMKHLEQISRIGPANAAVLDVLGGEIRGQGGTLLIDKRLVPKLRFIKEGDMKREERPILKLLGDVKPVSVVGHRQRAGVEGAGLRITDDLSAPVVRVKEEDFLKEYPLGYYELTQEMVSRYVDFKTNQSYHDLRKKFKKDPGLCRTRYLDPDNPKSSKKDFYSHRILNKFDRHYKKRS